MISYEKYIDYDSLDALDINFTGKPLKNKLTNVYTLPLINPINLTIPQSKIIEIYQNNQNNYLFQYVIDDFELLQFLNNIDTKIINIAQEKSPEWFNKQLSHRQLIKLYDSVLYEEEVYKLLDISINAQNIEEVLEDMSEYNEDEIDNITISLVGIEFYRKTFKLCIELTAIEYTSGEDEMSASVDDEETYENRVTEREESETENDDELDLGLLMSDNREGADESRDRDTDTDINDDSETDDIDSRDLLSDTETRLEEGYNDPSAVSIDESDKGDILEMIQLKEKEQEKYRLNSERAKEASVSLDDMASNLDIEILKYKSQLKKYTKN